MIKKEIMLFAVLFLFFISLASASFVFGNVSSSISDSYSTSDILKGWINLSFRNESASNISFLGQTFNLLDFLNNNSADYTCIPSDCGNSYSSVESFSSRSFVLSSNESKIIGLKLIGNLPDNPVQSVSFKVESNAGESCSSQLKIDVNDDNIIDWIPRTGSNIFNCYKTWGCYDYSVPNTNYEIWTSPYCEKMILLPQPGFMIGADIIKGSSNPVLKMQVYDEDFQKLDECTLPSISVSGEYSCKINLTLIEQKEAYVCIVGDGQTNYAIKGEAEGSVCGYYDVVNSQENVSDYSIFAEGGKFAPIGSFVFNESSFRKFLSDDSSILKDYINEYIYEKYDNSCSNGCIIPVKFISNTGQEIKISELVLKYSSPGIRTENNFYTIEKKSPIINSGFIKLDLEKANFNVPSVKGNYSTIMWIGDNFLLRKDIKVGAASSKIKDITPGTAPALVPVYFRAVLENSSGNLSYLWNFGDGSAEEISNTNYVKHSYSTIGNYNLNVKIIGTEVSKTISINVISPKNSINSTISNYKNNIKNFESYILNLPVLIKNYAEEQSNLNSVKTQLQAIETSYAGGNIDDAKAVEIMGELVELNVPSDLKIIKRNENVQYFIDENIINIDALSSFGAGENNNGRTEYARAIAGWIEQNAKINLDFAEYSIILSNGESFFSYIKFIIEPNAEIKNLYVAINGDNDNIKLSSGLGEKEISNAVGFELNDLNEKTEFEVLYNEKLDVLGLPVSISPDFEELLFNSNCNLNGICEKEYDETSSNCSDCKKSNLFLFILIIAIIIIVFFIVYIIVQEWYKNSYEKSLFKDRNQLFNLINFMNTAILKGFDKGEFLKKLKQMGWSGEQLSYAWKKLNGKRTGMWEIPIFKSAENIEVKRELQKRQ